MTPEADVLMVGAAMLGFVAAVGAYVTKSFQVGSNYEQQNKLVEKEKIVAEKLNGRFAMMNSSHWWELI